MADSRISQLNELTGSLAGNETLAIVSGGSTQKITVDNLISTASYAITASYAFSSSHEITLEVSSSHAESADTVPFLGITGKPTLLSGSQQIENLGFITSSTMVEGTISSSTQITDFGFISPSGGTIDIPGVKIQYSNVYNSTGDLPSATDYHGMFAHVHSEGAGYFAHAGSWIELANSSSFATNISTNVNNISLNTTDINSLQSVTSSYANTGSNDFNGNQNISGSLTVGYTASLSHILTLTPIDTLPSDSPTGSLAVTGSVLAFYDGVNWLKISGSLF